MAEWVDFATALADLRSEKTDYYHLNDAFVELEHLKLERRAKAAFSGLHLSAFFLI